jgi:hypothetical protein
MPRDERRRQKKLLKKRQKAKAVSKWRNTQSNVTTSPRALVRSAREYPILECLINDNWDTGDAEGFSQIVIARQQPDGGIAFGVYLVDMFCLGLKSTFCNAGFSLSEYRNEIVPPAIQPAKPKKCPPELAHQLIYQGIDYAAQFGFKPDKDFKWSHYILEERGTLEEPYKLTFGKDGKPFFVAGPYDNVDVIIRRLEKNAGPGNYDYLVFVDDPSGADFDLDELDDEEDDDE